jgi:ribosomal protein L23
MARAKPGERTQKDMVEEILNGGTEKPIEIVKAVKETFGVSIAKVNVNQIKIAWKKRGAAPVAAIRKPRAKVANPNNGISVGNHSKLDAVNAVLMLCEKFGVDQAGAIIEALKSGNG